MNTQLLARTLSDFAGEGYAYVPMWGVATGGEFDWPEIRRKLTEWEEKGFLKIIKDPEICDKDEFCIEMLNFIDAKEALPNYWLSKNRFPPRWPDNKPFPPV